MASSEVTVKVDGLRRLGRELRRAGADLADLKAANATAAATVAAEAERRAPRRTGKLAGSLRGNRATGRATVLAGGARVPYAGPIHYGWPGRGIEAHPFVTDAAQATEATWLPAYERAIADVVDSVGGTY